MKIGKRIVVCLDRSAKVPLIALIFSCYEGKILYSIIFRFMLLLVYEQKKYYYLDIFKIQSICHEKRPFWEKIPKSLFFAEIVRRVSEKLNLKNAGCKRAGF